MKAKPPTNGGAPPRPDRERATKEELWAALEHHERHAAVVSGINRVLSETLDCETEEEVAAVCLAVAEELTGSAFGWVGVLNQTGRLDTLAMSDPGYAACKIPEERSCVVIKNMELRGIWGGVLRDGETRLLNAPAEHPDWRGTPEGHPEVTCFLGVPLKRGDQTIGAISLANKAGGYDAADREAIEALSTSFVATLVRWRTERVVARQARELIDLSTPIIRIWEGVVVAPLIGTLDSNRTQRFMEILLEAIVETRSEIAIIDITGVAAIDTQTAQSLIEAATAVRLLGAQVVLTGIRPAIAQTLVQLGIDLGGMATRATLAAGLQLALADLGQSVETKRNEKTGSR